MNHVPNTAVIAVATGLWTTAFGLGIAGTVYSSPVLRFWAVIVALGSCAFTVHIEVVHALRRERERLLAGMVADAREHLEAGPTRLRR